MSSEAEAIAQMPLPSIVDGLLSLEARRKDLVLEDPQSDAARRKMIGARLKKIRELQGIAQKDLAKRIGTSPALITAYETGYREPSLKNLIRLAKALNFSTDWLLGVPPPNYSQYLQGLQQ